MSKETIIPCGGCGEHDPAKRCVGCGHPFTQAAERVAVPGAGSFRMKDSAVVISAINAVQNDPDTAAFRAMAQARATPPQQATPAETTYAYARNLAESLHRKHFPHVPQWQPFDDTLGVLTQIDNMVCGLVEPVASTIAAAQPDERAAFDAFIAAHKLNTQMCDGQFPGTPLDFVHAGAWAAWQARAALATRGAK